MKKFSILSKKRLAQVHPELNYLFNEVIKNYECTVVDPSRHQYKSASEATPTTCDTKMMVSVIPAPIKWDGVKRFHHFAGYVLGVAQRLYDEGKMQHKVRWGGNWDMDNDLSDQKYADFPHFELV